MKRTMTRMVVLAVAMLALLSNRAAAQAPLTAADAAAFLGAWTLGLDTPQGHMDMELTIKDEAGKVTGAITAAPLIPDVMTIDVIAKDGANLVLRYVLSVQGMTIPAAISLMPDGADKWKASFEFADGQFVTEGTAAKK